MAIKRMSVQVRQSLVDALRDTVSADPSPVGRLFDPKRASRAKICDAALEVAAWVCSGGFAKDLLDRWMPEFERRLLETHESAYLLGAHEAARFLGAELEIDPERGIITIHPPAALADDVGTGEINARPLLEPKMSKTVLH